MPGVLEQDDRGATKREGTHSKPEGVQVIVGPNAPSFHVPGDYRFIWLLSKHVLNIFEESEDKHRQGIVHIH